MIYTVYLSEIQHGYVDFETEEEALSFVNGTDFNYGLVEWVEGEILDLSIDYSEYN